MIDAYWVCLGPAEITFLGVCLLVALVVRFYRH
jgi:hypothetical protein